MGIIKKEHYERVVNEGEKDFLMMVGQRHIYSGRSGDKIRFFADLATEVGLKDCEGCNDDWMLRLGDAFVEYVTGQLVINQKMSATKSGMKYETTKLKKGETRPKINIYGKDDEDNGDD